MALRWLATLATMPHVLTAVLVSDDGLEVEAVGGTVISTSALAAEVASLGRLASEVSGRLGGGRLFRYSITTDQFELITIRAGAQHALGVAAQRGADLRNIQVEMARLALQLVQDLG